MIKGAGNGYNGTRKGKIQPLSGNGEVLSGLIKNSGMLIADGADSFRFRDIFREFLTREDARTRTGARHSPAAGFIMSSTAMSGARSIFTIRAARATRSASF